MMRWSMRTRSIAVMSAFVVAAILAVGFVDHQHKAHAMRHASVAHWKCVHHGRLCGVEDQHAIERHWNARERAYVGAIGVVVLANVGMTFAARSRRRRTL
jgi:hypothetical protein